MSLVPITQYRDFWDIPRIFLVSKDETNFLFDCRYNEDKEDYDTVYKVFIMPELSTEEISHSWFRLSEKSAKYLGDVPTAEITFDETRRRFIDDEVISKLQSPKEQQ